MKTAISFTQFLSRASCLASVSSVPLCHVFENLRMVCKSLHWWMQFQDLGLLEVSGRLFKGVKKDLKKVSVLLEKKVIQKWEIDNPQRSWPLKTGFFEALTPATQVQTLPLEGPMIFREYYFQAAIEIPVFFVNVYRSQLLRFYVTGGFAVVCGQRWLPWWFTVEGWTWICRCSSGQLYKSCHFSIVELVQPTCHW